MGSPNKLSQITRRLVEGERRQMTQDVANVTLIPNLLEAPDEGSVGAPVMTK